MLAIFVCHCCQIQVSDEAAYCCCCPCRPQVGTWYNTFRAKAQRINRGLAWGPGSAVFTYPNSQRSTMIWYHDHT